jgi:hypothetical protein
MDAVTLYAILTLANGAMETHAVPMQSTVQCEQLIARLVARLPKNSVLAWCRGDSILVIAH